MPERLTNGGRFELLPVHAACVAELFDAVAESKDEISPWMEWCHSDYSADETKQWVESRSRDWEQGKEYSFLTLDAQSKQVLGTCGLNDVHARHRFANLGYWIPDFPDTGRCSDGSDPVARRFWICNPWVGPNRDCRRSGKFQQPESSGESRRLPGGLTAQSHYSQGRSSRRVYVLPRPVGSLMVRVSGEIRFAGERIDGNIGVRLRRGQSPSTNTK